MTTMTSVSSTALAHREPGLRSCAMAENLRDAARRSGDARSPGHAEAVQARQESPEAGKGIDSTMGQIDKAKNKLEEAKGQTKEQAGRALDDPYLEGEGTAEKVAGDLKQAGEKVKDAFK